jgi:hypothetical protein
VENKLSFKALRSLEKSGVTIKETLISIEESNKMNRRERKKRRTAIRGMVMEEDIEEEMTITDAQ